MTEGVFRTVLEISVAASAVAALLILMRPLLGRRYAAKWRYWAWLLLAVRLLLPFNIELPQKAVVIPAVQQELVYAVDEQKLPVIEQPAYPTMQEGQTEIQPEQLQQYHAAVQSYDNQVQEARKQAGRTVTVMQLCAYIWAAGAVAFIAVELIAYARVCGSVRRHGRAVDIPQVWALAEQVADELEIHRPIRLVVCDGIKSPMILGLMKPTILIPSASYIKRDLYMVFRHELIHYVRHDIWYKLLMLLANAVHWFNPVVWLMAREADRDIEISCDDAVVEGRDEDFREQYSDSILAVMRAGYNRSTMFSTSFHSGKKIMKQRFANILDTTRKRKGWLALCALLAAAVLVCGLVACGGASQEEQPGTQEPVSKTYAPEELEGLFYTYVAPAHSLTSYGWSGADELNGTQLLWFALNNLYGWYGATDIDYREIYAIKTDGLIADGIGGFDTDAEGYLSLPTDYINSFINKHIEHTEDFRLAYSFEAVSAEDSGKTAQAIRHDEPGYSTWSVAYPISASQEGDLLTIVCRIFDVSSNWDYFLSHRDNYVAGMNSQGDYALSIRLDEDGGFTYLSYTQYRPILDKPEPSYSDIRQVAGVREQIGWYAHEDVKTLDEWQELFVYSDWVLTEPWDEKHSVSHYEWMERRFVVYSTPEGSAYDRYIVTYALVPHGYNADTGEVGYFHEVRALGYNEAQAGFGDYSAARIFTDTEDNYSGYSLYDPQTDLCLGLDFDNQLVLPVSDIGERPLIVNYRQDNALSGLSDSQSYYIYYLNHRIIDSEDESVYSYGFDIAVYEAATGKLTIVGEDLRGANTITLETSKTDGGSVFALMDNTASYIRFYDPASPEQPIAVLDKTTIPLEAGCEDVRFSNRISLDERDAGLIAIMYCQYDAEQSNDLTEGSYADTDMHWRIGVISAGSIGTLSDSFATTQCVRLLGKTAQQPTDVVLRGGLLYFSYYFDMNGNSERERWVYNITDPAHPSQLIESSVFNSADYDSESFLSKAHALGYSKEQLDYCRECGLSADLVLNYTGMGRLGTNRFSPDGVWYLEGYTVSAGGEAMTAIMYLRSQDTGEIRIVPGFFYGYGSYGFAGSDRIWISQASIGGAGNFAGTAFYSLESLKLDSADKSPVAVWKLADYIDYSKLKADDPIKVFAGTRNERDQGFMATFWYTVPNSWSSWDESSWTDSDYTYTYMVTVYDYAGKELATYDTGIRLIAGRYGGAEWPRLDTSEYEKNNVFFDLGEYGLYKINVLTGKISKTA